LDSVGATDWHRFNLQPWINTDKDLISHRSTQINADKDLMSRGSTRIKINNNNNNNKYEKLIKYEEQYNPARESRNRTSFRLSYTIEITASGYRYAVYV
jgi:hypothetical protein